MSAALLCGVCAGAGPLVAVFALWARTRRLTRTVAALHADLRAARHEAEHDGLTGLPNRVALYRRGAPLLTEAVGRVAVAVIDVDDFKAVNDTYGHRVGDLVLRTLGARLTERVAGDGVLARLGGDEFAAVLRLRDGETPRSLGEALASVTHRPVDLRGAGSLRVSVSVGVAPVPRVGQPTELGEMLGRADAAMYRSKQTGAVAVYAPWMDDHTTSQSGDRPAVRTRDLDAREALPTDLPTAA
jgi:diguanylate cyclase (GGDEF)-like protein